jgi:hypothetical protein
MNIKLVGSYGPEKSCNCRYEKVMNEPAEFFLPFSLFCFLHFFPLWLFPSVWLYIILLIFTLNLFHFINYFVSFNFNFTFCSYFHSTPSGLLLGPALIVPSLYHWLFSDVVCCSTLKCGSNISLQNVGNYLVCYMTLHPWKQQTSFWLLLFLIYFLIK